MNGIAQRGAAITAAAVAAGLLVPAGGDAATFCVGKPGTCAGTNFATMQDAVVASNGNGDGEQDRIEVGAGTFPGPTTGTATPVDIVGEGAGATTISGSAGATTLIVNGTGISTVSALQIVMDANDSPGLRLGSSDPASPSSAANLLVTGSGAPAGAVGVQLMNGSALRDSSVNMTVGTPSTAVTTQGGPVERTHLEGATGLIGTGTSRRLVIVAGSVGARPADAGGNLTLDQATVRMTAAGTALLIPSAPPPLNNPLSLTAGHVTAVGTGAGTGASVTGSCTIIPGLSTVLRMRNTILRGFAIDRRREGVANCAPGNAPGLLEAAYSIFDPAKTADAGPGGFFENSLSIPAGSPGTTNLNVDPLFVNAGGFDFHLGAGSPAMETGDPAALFSSESPVDLDGNPRVADGNSDGTPRRDIGAFEFPAPDADGDGVPDTSDSCPGVAAQTANGCPDQGGGGGGPGGGGGDTTAPSVALGGKKKQKVDGTIEVRVGCDEACDVQGGGTLTVSSPSGRGARDAAKPRVKRFQLRGASASIALGASAVLKLKLPKKANRAALRALKRSGRVRAKISVSAADATGNKGQASETVRLVKRRR
jgi:hypothetical protein